MSSWDLKVRLIATATCFVFVSSFVQAQSKGDLSKEAKPTEQDARIGRIEAIVVDVPMGPGEAPIRLNLSQLMQSFNVPGLSIAVVDNYQIRWAKAYGVLAVGSQEPVTTKTLFQAGSISKPVTATGALYLVERGKLVLDEDVNQKLKTWKLPENEFTKTEKVTLRRLMTHTGGLTVHGFPGYDVNDPLPTLVQILNGETPANTAPIRVDTIPGTEESYSGGGVTIEQQLMIDVTGKTFPVLMRETVLDKIGMTDSSYEEPLPSTRAALTPSGTYSDGKPVHGKWHIYPEMAAAGLWSTPTDLAHFAIEIALSSQGKSNHILSTQMTREMLTPVMEDAALGFFIDKQNPGQFGHYGADEGFQALLTMNAETGKGVAIMANSDHGNTVEDLLLRSVAKEYAWNYKTQRESEQNLAVVAMVRGVPAALRYFDGMKKSAASNSKVNERTLNRLGYMLLRSEESADAVQVFQRNVQEYPQSATVYESLAEGFLKLGRKDLAIQNYERSLQLNPDNKDAVETLKKLKEPKRD